MYRDIINEILNVYNINASELAEKIDVQRSGISHILSGRNKPSIDFMLKIKKQFPDIEWKYLMTGKGPILITKVNKMESQSEMEKKRENIPTLFDEEEKQGVEPSKKTKPQDVLKIVWFYNDNTFDVFYPEN